MYEVKVSLRSLAAGGLSALATDTLSRVADGRHNSFPMRTFLHLFYTCHTQRKLNEKDECMALQPAGGTHPRESERKRLSIFKIKIYFFSL